MRYHLFTRAVTIPQGKLVNRYRAKLVELRNRAPVHALEFQLFRFDPLAVIQVGYVSRGNIVFGEDDEPICAYTHFFLRNETSPQEFFPAMEGAMGTGRQEALVRTSLLSLRSRLIQICEGSEIGWWRFYFDEAECATIERTHRNAELIRIYNSRLREERLRMDDEEMDINARLLKQAGY